MITDPEMIEAGSDYELALAYELADVSARSSIEAACRAVVSGEHSWYDLGSIPARDAKWSGHCLTYMELRGDRLDYRVIRCKAFPSLVRFEDKS